MWIWHERGRRIDIVSQGEFSFSPAVPLGFAEIQRAGRDGWAGTERPGSCGCASVPWASLNKLPSAAPWLTFPTWKWGSMLTFLSALRGLWIVTFVVDVVFLGLHPCNMEVAGLGVKTEL